MRSIRWINFAVKHSILSECENKICCATFCLHARSSFCCYFQGISECSWGWRNKLRLIWLLVILFSFLASVAAVDVSCCLSFYPCWFRNSIFFVVQFLSVLFFCSLVDYKIDEYYMLQLTVRYNTKHLI